VAEETIRVAPIDQAVDDRADDQGFEDVDRSASGPAATGTLKTLS
jgi:hypothetical protein